MTHFVNQNCIKCKYTDCVEVCPVDCFHEGEEMLVIDPEVCIDCGVCVSECPVEAIINSDHFIDGKSFSDVLDLKDSGAELTEAQEEHVVMCKFNDCYSKKWPVLNMKKEKMVEAEKFKDNLNKLSYIEGNLKKLSENI